MRELECFKLKSFKQAIALNILAWNKKIGPQFYFVGTRAEVIVRHRSLRTIQIILNHLLA